MHKSMMIVIALVALFIAVPVAAAPLGVGMFSGASTVTKQDGQYVIELGGDFSFDGAPDPYVALGKRKKPLEGGLIAVLKSDKGAQRYAIDASAALDGATQVIIWCKKYSVPLGVAAIE